MISRINSLQRTRMYLLKELLKPTLFHHQQTHHYSLNNQAKKHYAKNNDTITASSENKVQLSSPKHPGLQIKNDQKPLQRSSSLSIPDNLKELEKQLELKKRREKTDYVNNITAALELPFSESKLEAWSEDSQTLLDKIKKYVVEHAARRVDLFFYTLIAYYKTKMTVVQGHTELQHGKGRTFNHKNLTQACHSSFFPSLVDESIKKNAKEQNSEIKKSLLFNTHFMDSLNSTMELPPFVNKLDDDLENHFLCRTKSLQIIDQVSQGKLNPVEGLNEFLKMMGQVFKQLDIEKFILHDSIPRDIKSELIDLVKKGTFGIKWSEEKQSVSTGYVDLLLRLRTEEKQVCQKSATDRSKIYNEKYKEIKKEILMTKSSHSHPLSRRMSI